MHSPSRFLLLTALGAALSGCTLRRRESTRLDRAGTPRGVESRLESRYVAAARRRQHARRSVRDVGLSRPGDAHAHARQSAGVRRRHAELHELSSRRRAPRRTPRRSSARSRAFPNTWIAAAPSCRSRIASTTASREASPDRSFRPTAARCRTSSPISSFISRGVPTGEHVRGEGHAEDAGARRRLDARRALFVDNCARCHGNDGAGMGPIPALWGARSFSIGASMARQERAASFIRHNMPFDRPGTLTDQQAYDVAAYITSMTRPDSPGKGDRLAERRRRRPTCRTTRRATRSRTSRACWRARRTRSHRSFRRPRR